MSTNRSKDRALRRPPARRVVPRAARDLLFAVVPQTLPLAQHEYINAYGTNSWRETIRTSHEQSADHVSPARSPIAASSISSSPYSRGAIGRISHLGLERKFTLTAGRPSAFSPSSGGLQTATASRERPFPSSRGHRC